MKKLAHLVCCLLIVLAVPAWAEISRDNAVAAAQQANAGRVLAVDKAVHDGKPVWRVKLLTAQGEVIVVLIDAASGRRL